jgi:HEAT repeat protein
MAKRRLILGIFTIGLLAALSMVLTRPREPSYQGRSLSEWVRRFHWSSNEDRKEAGEAIRQIGTNALPYLLEAIQCEVPHWKQTVRMAIERIPWRLQPRGLWLSQPDDTASAAANAFIPLGAEAQCAIPELIGILNDPKHFHTAPRAAFALGAIGKPALGPLLNVVTNGRIQIRSFAITAIGSMGTNAAPALPLFIKHLKHQDLPLAYSAALALGTMKTDPAIVLPALANALQDPRPPVRMAAVRSLGDLGEGARSATANVLAAFSDIEWQVRLNATNALQKIAPEVLTNTPTE